MAFYIRAPLNTVVLAPPGDRDEGPVPPGERQLPRRADLPRDHAPGLGALVPPRGAPAAGCSRAVVDPVFIFCEALPPSA